jgi:hypothetical protein
MTVNSKRTTSSVALSANGDKLYQAIGLIMAVLVPATFWTFAIASAGMLTSDPISNALLLTLAITIVVFLAIVCSPLMLGNKPECVRR